MAEDAGGKEVGRISIRVVPNLKKFWSDLKDELTAIEKTLEAKIRIVPDFNGFREKVAAEASNVKDAKVKVKADLDQSDFAKTLAEAKAIASQAGLKLKVDIRDKEAEAQLARTLLKLEAEARLAKIKVKVDVDRKVNRNGGIVGGIMGGLGELGSAAGSGLKMLSDDTTLIAVAILALAAPALALLSGLLVSLPAIIAAVALPIGVIALGIEGLGKAAQVLAVPFQALKDTLSQKFQDVFTPIFRGLAPVLPAIGQALLPIVDRLGDTAKGLISVVTSNEGMTALHTTVDNIGKAMAVAVPGIKDFTSGLLNLIAGGSKSLPQFAGLFDSLGNQFSNWVKKISTNDWWGTSPLDRALANFKTALEGIMDLLSELGSDGFDMLADPKMGTDIKDFFENLKDFVHNALPALKDFFHDLSTGLSEANKIMDRISGWKAPDWLKGDDNGGKPKQTVGKLGPFPGFLDEDGNGEADVWTTIKGWFSPEKAKANLDAPLGIVGTWIGEKLGQIDFSGLWSKLTSSIGDDVMSGNPFGMIGDWVADAFNSIDWSGIWSGLTSQFTSDGGGFNPFGQIGQLAQDALGQIDWGGMWDGFTSSVSTACDNAANFFSGLAGKIPGLFTGIDLSAAGAAIINGLKAGMESAFEGVKSFVSGIKQWIVDHKGPVSADAVALTPAGLALMQGLQSGLEGGFEGVMSRAKAMADQIKTGMQDGFAGINLDQLKKNLKQEMDEVSLERDQLKTQLDGTTDKGQKAALRDQMKQLSTVRDTLKLQSDQLGFSQKYSDKQGDIGQQLGQQLSKTIDIGKGFGEANLKQFMGDIGASGNGAIPQIAETGIGWVTGMLGNLVQGAFGGQGTTIQVNSVDEALAARQNIVNKQSLQYVGR